MKNKNKVLFLIPSLVGGGAERTLINILKNINYSLYEIHLVIVENKGIYIKDVPKNIKLISLFSNSFILRSLSFIHKYTGFNEIINRRFLKKIDNNYDTAISFLDSNFTDLLFKIPNVKKKITWVHSSYKTNSNFYKFYKNINYKNRLISKRYSKLDYIIFVSQDAKNEFLEVFGSFRNMPVIYNFMDKKNIILNSKSFKPKHIKNLIKFISVGSLIPVKGYDLLILAANKLKEYNKNFIIEIFGEGYLRNNLLDLIKKYKLQRHIKLKGFVDNPYPYIKNSDIFLMTSRSEAMPMALCEAMILGKPVLVTNSSGCREVVNYGEFGLISSYDADDLAKKMLKLIEDKKLRDKLSMDSIHRAKLFSGKKILQQIEMILIKE
tara:strand:- start:1823 stop:2962 length:1140 start_codon:yes stop_codon:yes gene_type:complete